MDTDAFPAHHSDEDIPQEPTVPAPLVPGAPDADATGVTWPALPPVARSGADPTSTPHSPYDEYNPWGTSAGTPTGTPMSTVPFAPPPGGGYPTGGYYYPAGQSQPRRRRGIPAWAYVLAVAAILGGLAVGIGLGRASQLPGSANTASSGGTPKLTLGAPSAPIVSVPGDTQSLQTSVENVVKAVLPSVVEITSSGQGGQAIGSGDILTKDGYIVTNDHVVDGYDSFTVTYANGTNVPATLFGTSPQNDLAVLKVSATNLQPIAIGDSSQAQVGEFVVAIGTPLGEQNSATFGDISGLNRTESEDPEGPADTLIGMIQTSAPIAPGNSGGALVDLKGELLGIPTLGSSNGGGRGSAGSSIGFAIASNQVKTVAQQLIQNGPSSQNGQGQPTSNSGFLGIRVQSVTPAIAAADGLSVQQGALVVDFAGDASGRSPAREAGMQAGDVITAVNGQQVSNESDLTGILANLTPGTTVNVTVVRGTSQLTINVTLGTRPANAQG